MRRNGPDELYTMVRLGEIAYSNSQNTYQFQYGVAGQLTRITSLMGSLREDFTYNSLLQVTRQRYRYGTQTWAQFDYVFNDGQNNGRISRMVDSLTGEEVNYAYDALNRLVSASTTGPQWGQSYSYDGFGNRYAEEVTKGAAPTTYLTFNPVNNRITTAGFSYDANGNLTAAPMRTMSYDVENRVTVVTHTGNGAEYYTYGPGNKRILKHNNTETVFHLYDVEGRLYKRYRLTQAQDGSAWFTQLDTYSYLGSRRLGGIQDRLGSHRADIVWNYGLWQVGQKYSYFPYGQDRTATPNDRFKFATYFRDAVAGLDYADQRYYGSTWGRFLTPDPYQASGGAAAPGSWNRYAYVEGDPVNYYDPPGLLAVSVDSEGNWHVDVPGWGPVPISGAGDQLPQSTIVPPFDDESVSALTGNFRVLPYFDGDNWRVDLEFSQQAWSSLLASDFVAVGAAGVLIAIGATATAPVIITATGAIVLTGALLVTAYQLNDAIEKNKSRRAPDWQVSCHIHPIGSPNHEGVEQMRVVVSARDYQEAYAIGTHIIKLRAQQKYGVTGFHLQHCDARQL
ncbi:MAG: RHS repeat-associated core domain-containing protein [Fimbriimonadaceae bacterium]